MDRKIVILSKIDDFWEIHDFRFWKWWKSVFCESLLIL